MNIDFEEQLCEIFSALQIIEGVKSVECIISILKDRVIFPEITTLILNSKFELVYVFDEQKVVFKTLKEVAIDSMYIKEINLINEHIHAIETILNELINTEVIANYSLHLLSLKYKEKIPNS